MTVVVQTANAALYLQNGQAWYWQSDTHIYSVAKGDVDDDGKTEIVTGGYYDDGTRDVAQLCVWNGATLALENVRTWYWTDDTWVMSVAIGDVDGDNGVEIVTGGWHNDGTRWNAQLCVWDGATLALENVKTWYWTSHTYIESVAVSDVDHDGDIEIVTGGSYNDGTRYNAQLCVWNGAKIALENIKTWYWIGHTNIWSVAVGDVDADGNVEIVTGGWHNDGTRARAQLCVWDGATLAFENVKTWYWESYTYIWSVGIEDVDHDGKTEIVTGGHYGEVADYVAQLCVWSGATLALEDVKTWYWIGNTEIYSVAVGDVTDDGKTDIVTGGHHYDGTREVAQLCVWGASGGST